jgi:phosphonate transport system substrate-binding protein
MTNETRGVAATILTAALLVVASSARADLTLGVHPFKPPSKVVEAFRPLAGYLSEKLGQPVSIRIAKDYQAHVDAVGRDEIDIAYVGPSSYVKLRETYGERPLLARQQIGSSPVYHSKIFVRKDSPIGALTDLKGKRFVFGEPHSTTSHLVPRYMLWQAGITVDQFFSHKFVSDHVNVALGVLSGDFDAGAVKEDVFYQYEARGLRAIATSGPLSEHLFVASRTLPEPTIRKLREALLQLDRDPQGAAILQSMTPGVTSLVPVQDSDYDSLRRVLKKLQELGIDG